MKRPTTLSATFALAIICAGTAGACTATLDGDEATDSSDDEKGGEELGQDAIPTETDACTSPAESFERELFVPVFSRCMGCHNETGLAQSGGSDFVLAFPESTDFVERNLATITQFAKDTVSTGGAELPLILAKPTLQIAHAGGQVLAEDSNEAQLLRSFVDKLADPPDCAPEPDAVTVALDSVGSSSDAQAYARAARLLTARAVDEVTLEQVQSGELSLQQALDELMKSVAFRRRLSSFYADAFLNLANDEINVGNDILDRGGWPSINYFDTPCDGKLTNICCSSERETCCRDEESEQWCAAGHDAIQHAIAYEPQAFIELMARDRLPITELVTRREAALNPYTAMILGFTPEDRNAVFDDDPANDADEWRFTTIPTTARNELPSAFGESRYPHAGVLSSPALLVKYYSTKSNLSRSRAARLVYEHFLDINVKSFADFSTAVLPADANLERATLDYPACATCHVALDPVARVFENHWGYGYFSPEDSSRFPDHFPEASFLGLTPGEGESPVAWLGQQLAEHERYRLALLKPLLSGLTGVRFLEAPQRPEASDYAVHWLAYRIQQSLLQEILSSLPDQGVTFQDLVHAAVQSTFFRAESTSAEGEQREALAMAGVGGGVLISPELLDGVTKDVLHGAGASVPGANGDAVISKRGFRYVLGGVNWLSIEERTRTVSPVAVRAVERIANELACKAVVRDFALVDASERSLFKNVEWDWTPGDHETGFRKDLSRMYLLLMGRIVPTDDARIDRALDLWRGAQAEGLRQIEDGVWSAGRTKCSVKDPPEGQRAVSDDPNYVLGAWTATLAYLLSDPDFILE